MMKVLQINATYNVGSIGRTTYEMTQYLKSQGVQCYNAIATKNPVNENEYRIESDSGVKRHALMSRMSGLQGYWSTGSTKKLLRWMDEIKPDVVHLRNLHSNYINLKLLLNYLAKNDIATVITLHDCWLYTGKCTYYVPCDCKKWMDKCGKCPLLHKDNVNPTWIFDRTSKCLSDKKKWFSAIPRLYVVGVSDWVRDEAKKSIFSGREIITIYNWIDQSVFKPHNTDELRQKLNLQDKFVVLMVASFISEIKGYNVMNYLAETLNSDYAIVVIGKNKFDLPLPDNVIHIEHTDNVQELSDYYAMADVCVNTTKYETFGKVTAESICCGTPVIVFNNTASPELVGDGCGYVIDENNYKGELLEKLNLIKQNNKASYSEKCVQFADLHFNKETNAHKYLTLYQKIT